MEDIEVVRRNNAIECHGQVPEVASQTEEPRAPMQQLAAPRRISIRQPLLLGVLAAGNIGVTVLYQWYVFVVLGPGVATDALFAGMTVPQLVVTIVSASLTQVLVPLLGGEPSDRFRSEAWAFFLLVGGLFALIATVLFIASSWWVPLLVPGFSDPGKELTVLLTRIQLLGMVFTALAGVQSAIYYARQRFVWVEVSQLIASATAFAALVALLPRYGVEAAAWIASARFALYALLQMPGMGAWTMPDLRGKSVQEAWRRIKPLLLGTAYYKTDTLVDRFLLSTAGNGSLSLFYLAQQVYGAGTGILGKAIVGPLVPHLSVLHKAGNRSAFRHAYHRGLWHTGLVTAGSIVVLLIWGKAILSVLIGHGAVTESNVATLWSIMVGLGGMFIGGAMGAVTSSSFYARGETRLPTRLAMVTYTIYVPIKIISFLAGGVMALAISVTGYYLLNLLIQWFYLEK